MDDLEGLYGRAVKRITQPCDLVGRIDEAARLHAFVVNAEKAKYGSSIYITGHSGVGKTVCVDHVLKLLEFAFVSVNLCTFEDGSLKQHM
jgi:Cdc6-like AAA superfamily ATPase